MFNQRSADPLSVGNIPPNETAMLYIEAVEENGRTNAVGHRRARQVRGDEPNRTWLSRLHSTCDTKSRISLISSRFT